MKVYPLRRPKGSKKSIYGFTQQIRNIDRNFDDKQTHKKNVNVMW